MTTSFADFMRRRGAGSAAKWGDPAPAPVEELRRRRAGGREATRAETRSSAFDARRRIRMPPPSPAPAPGRAAADSRRRQLEEWRRRRRQERERAPKPKPPFRAAVRPKHDDDPRPLATAPQVPLPGPMRRVTRSQTTKRLPASKAETRPPKVEAKVEPKIETKVEAEVEAEDRPIEPPPALPLGPNVTLRRGKGNDVARRSSTPPSPEKSAAFFRRQLDGEVRRLDEACRRWERYQKDNPLLRERHRDAIDVAVGQTRLLLSKKFEQFRGLVERCESREIFDGEGLVNVDDLQGFWDMVYMQVENVDVKFNDLKSLEGKGWTDEREAPRIAPKKATTTTKTAPKKEIKSSGLRALILAAKRKASDETAKSETKEMGQSNENKITFDGGFFSIVSPVKEKIEKCATPTKESLRRSVLSNEANKKVATPLHVNAVLSANCLAKSIAFKEPIHDRGDFVSAPPIDLSKTPGKSILKTPINNEYITFVPKKSVKLVFSPDETSEVVDPPNSDCDKENITKKVKTRRSRRSLTKQSKVDLPSPDPIDVEKVSNEPLLDLSSDLILSELPAENAEVSESFIEVFGMPSKYRRKTIRQSTAKRTSNLITFDSPPLPAYNTRSVSRRSTFRNE